MASVALAVLRAGTPISSSLGRDGDVILATDVGVWLSLHRLIILFIFCFPDSAMPLLQLNISTNSHYFLSAIPQALVLDWYDEALPPEVCDLGGLDVIV
jgi:hypothetical protein